MSKLKYRAFLIILVAGLASAQVYKWVDEKGGIHFGDRPPEDVSPEKISLPEGPTEEEVSKAKEEFRESVGALQQQIHSSTVTSKTVDSNTTDKIRQDRICVETIYQLEVLRTAPRVYKQSNSSSRVYLDEAKRQEEIERLESERQQYCSTDRKVEADQQSRAQELVKLLGPNCAVMRDTLTAMENPNSRTPADELAEQRDIVERECPSVSTQDLWIRDWIYSRQDDSNVRPTPPLPPTPPKPATPIQGHLLPKK